MCNPKAWVNGTSYYAINQWFVANLQPLLLAAIIPWEGFADIYRDALFHGGLLNVFMTNWVTAHLMHHMLGRASRHQPDGWQVNTMHFWLRNNLDSGAVPRRSRRSGTASRCRCSQVGNWTGMSLHLRGNTEAFMRAASKTQEVAHPYRLARPSVYVEEGRRDQLRFLDYWLKGVKNGVMDEPPVRLAIRKAATRSSGATKHEWSLARTRWTKFHFDLSPPPADKPSTGALVGANSGAVPACAAMRRRASARWARPRPPHRR